MAKYDSVERSVDVAAAPAAILPLLTDFRRWPEWSPWERLDPQLRRTYSGPTSGLGATYEWSGNRQTGAGTMTIASVRGSAVVIHISFARPFKSTARSIFTLTATEKGTHLVWRMRFPRTRLSPIVGLLFNREKLIGKDLASGLAALAKVAATAT